MGAFLSIIVLLVSSFFLYSKAMVLYKVSDVTIMMRQLEGALTYNDKFTAENGLFLAAALTEYDSNTELLEEERYGELVISKYGWGNDENFSFYNDVIDSHFCSD